MKIGSKTSKKVSKKSLNKKQKKKKKPQSTVTSKALKELGLNPSRAKDAHHTNPQSLNVIRDIQRKLKEQGVDLTDLRTYNDVHKEELIKDGQWYVCSVTDDCPADALYAGGIDFPRYVQPIPTGGKSRRRMQKLSGRPQRLKRALLSKKMVEKILISAHAKWIPISLPTGEKDQNGYPQTYSDKVRAIYFIVLTPIDESSADPISPVPVVERDLEVTKKVSKALEVERMLEEHGAVRIESGKGGAITKRNIEAMKGERSNG